MQPGVRVADLGEDVRLAHRLQLKQVADRKDADVAKHAGRVCAFELLQTFVYLEQHVGPHHGDFVDDEQLQVGQLGPQRVELVLCEGLAGCVCGAQHQCRVQGHPLYVEGRHSRRCTEENCDVVRLHVAGESEQLDGVVVDQRYDMALSDSARAAEEDSVRLDRLALPHGYDGVFTPLAMDRHHLPLLGVQPSHHGSVLIWREKLSVCFCGVSLQ